MVNLALLVATDQLLKAKLAMPAQDSGPHGVHTVLALLHATEELWKGSKIISLYSQGLPFNN